MSVKVFSGNRMIDTVKGSIIEKKISILVENEIIVAIDSPDKISSHPLFEDYGNALKKKVTEFLKILH